MQQNKGGAYFCKSLQVGRHFSNDGYLVPLPTYFKKIRQAHKTCMRLAAGSGFHVLLCGRFLTFCRKSPNWVEVTSSFTILMSIFLIICLFFLVFSRQELRACGRHRHHQLCGRNCKKLLLSSFFQHIVYVGAACFLVIFFIAPSKSHSNLLSNVPELNSLCCECQRGWSQEQVVAGCSPSLHTGETFSSSFAESHEQAEASAAKR